MLGILAILRRQLWHTRPIRAGGIDRNSLTDETKSMLTCLASGLRNWITGSSRKCGRLTGNRIAVRFAYQWRDDSDHWYRSYGNENWEFNDDGLMASRFASIHDLPILASDRKYYWPLGRRPDKHPGLSDLGL
jgi:hypothetical protein